MNLNKDRLFELAQIALVRMDGAWFMAVAKQFGKEAAWKTDVAAWSQLSYVLGKYMRGSIPDEPKWPEDYLDVLDALLTIMKMDERSITVNGELITVRVTNCETQKAIARAGIADCGIATMEIYKGLARGLFGKDFEVTVSHTKNLNRGDDCCEIILSKSQKALLADAFSAK
jgi:hypothetical protein